MSDHQHTSFSKAEKSKILEAFLSNQVAPEDWLLDELMEEIMPSQLKRTSAIEPKIAISSSEASSKQESTSSTPTAPIQQPIIIPTIAQPSPIKQNFTHKNQEKDNKLETHSTLNLKSAGGPNGKIEKPVKVFRKYRGSELWKEALVKKLEEMDPSQCHDKSKKLPYEHLLSEFTLK